jgi:hypothetical protein
VAEETDTSKTLLKTLLSNKELNEEDLTTELTKSTTELPNEDTDKLELELENTGKLKEDCTLKSETD